MSDIIYPCEYCQSPSKKSHHKFPQHKAHRKKYGKLIDKSFNKMAVCYNCHSSHSHMDQKDIWDEETFIKELTKYVDRLERKLEIFV